MLNEKLNSKAVQIIGSHATVDKYSSDNEVRKLFIHSDDTSEFSTSCF